MVGEAGIYLSFLIIALTVAVALIAALSAIGKLPFIPTFNPFIF